MSPAGTAIQQALLLQRQPEILFELQQSPLPEGMAALIRLVSDDGSFLDGLAQATHVDGELLRQAAASYLRSICLFPGSHGPRVLALNDAHDIQLAKDHHRLLIKWLHPDRNPQNEALAERVNQAWSQLKAKRPAVPASAAADPRFAHDRRIVPKSRFAWFLGGLTSLSVFFLLLSLLPEQEVYVSGINAEKALGATETDLTEEEANAPLASLRQVAWAEPAPAAPAPQAAPGPAPARKSAPENPVAAGAFSPTRSGTAAVAPVAMTQVPVTTVAGPIPRADKPAAKSLPPVAAIESTHADKDALVEPPRAQGLSVADAKAMLPLFMGRYRQGDIEGFMDLFSRSARNNRGDREAIEEDYEKLFAGSQRRELEFSQLQWHPNEGRIVLQARYRSKVRSEGAMLAVVNKGRIELAFIEEGGDVRIQHILIGE